MRLFTRLLLCGSMLIASNAIFAQTPPIDESFENGLPNDWSTMANPAQWQHTATNGHTGPSAMYIYDSGIDTARGMLITPFIDLSNFATPEIYFRGAIVGTGAVAPELVLWSDDGSGWVYVTSFGPPESDADQRVTRSLPPTSNPAVWVPPSQSSWHSIHNTVLQASNQSNVRFALEFVSPDGGAAWVDEFFVLNSMVWFYPLAVEDEQEALNFSVFPNPTQGLITIQSEAPFASASVLVRNVVGQTVSTMNKFTGNSLQLELPDQAGLYFVEVYSEDKLIARERVVRKDR